MSSIHLLNMIGISIEVTVASSGAAVTAVQRARSATVFEAVRSSIIEIEECFKC